MSFTDFQKNKIYLIKFHECQKFYDSLMKIMESVACGLRNFC